MLYAAQGRIQNFAHAGAGIREGGRFLNDLNFLKYQT